MNRNLMPHDTKQHSINDEAIFLRVQQLQAGLLQFTDATTAYRMLKEYGKDVRYIAPWKKWIVWNGTQWEADNGPLIYTKGLEIVRNL